MADREGVFFSVDELLAVFPRLKRLEAVLKRDERAVLARMEKALYRNLSISEMETSLKNFENAEDSGEISRETAVEGLFR
ncbi:MAG: hypothetical protein LBH35_07870 [Treponema sp.]|jgi:hypothetical protein|nr:hypothetical protein [Treponema sp.]